MNTTQKWLTKMMKKKKGKKGFSLAELMLVVMIMAILITIIVVSGGGIQTYVNETIMKTEAKQVLNYCSIALSQYSSEQSGALEDSVDCDLTITAATQASGNTRYEVTFLSTGLNAEDTRIEFLSSTEAVEIEDVLSKVIDGGLTVNDKITFEAELASNGFSYNFVSFSYESAKRNMVANLNTDGSFSVGTTGDTTNNGDTTSTSQTSAQ